MKIEFLKKCFGFNSRNMHPSKKNRLYGMPEWHNLPEALYYITLHYITVHYIMYAYIIFSTLGCNFYFDMSNVPFKGRVLEVSL